MNDLAPALQRAGIRCVFGIPGTQNVELFEGFRRARMHTVLTASELGAAFAAGAFARVSGDVGVLVTIAGPGFMYALPGIAEAQADSAAVVHITGLPAAEPGRQFQLQAIDQAAIAGPLVKAVISARGPEHVAAATAAAIAVARAGEPGPVLLQIGSATTGESAEPELATVLPERGLDEAAQAFAAARRPVLLVGQGASKAAADVVRAAEARRVPVITTPSGRGTIPEDHPLSCGFDPLRHNLADVNALLDQSDLILALGCKLGHNGSAGFGLALPSARLVHVDSSPAVPGANYPTRLSACAPASRFLAAIMAGPLVVSQWHEAEVSEWRLRVRAEGPLDLEPVIGESGGNARDFFLALRRSLPRAAILVTDSGMHQVLARRYYDVLAPAGLLLPSDFQSMGFGVPAAIGAALAAPDRRVVAVVGDGGLRMTGMELTTAVRERLPIVLFVFSDGKLNQIRFQQIKEYGRDHAVDLAPLNLEQFAAAAGARYARYAGDVGAMLDEAMTFEGPTLVEVAVRDSSGVLGARLSGIAREGVRRALGPRLLSWLRRRT